MWFGQGYRQEVKVHEVCVVSEKLSLNLWQRLLEREREREPSLRLYTRRQSLEFQIFSNYTHLGSPSGGREAKVREVKGIVLSSGRRRVIGGRKRRQPGTERKRERRKREKEIDTVPHVRERERLTRLWEQAEPED